MYYDLKIVVVKGILLFQVYLIFVSLMEKERKLGFTALAKSKSLFLALLWCVIEMGKRTVVFPFLFIGNFLTFTMIFTMPQVFSSDLLK